MMRSAERLRALVADFATQGAWLSELQVMRISRCLLTNQTDLAAYKREMILAPSSRPLFGEGKTRLLSRRGVGRRVNIAGDLRRTLTSGNRPIADTGCYTDIITDFHPGSAIDHDEVKLDGFSFTSFGEITAAMAGRIRRRS